MRIIAVFVVTVLVCSVSCTAESEKHGNPIHAEHYKDGDHDEDYDHEAILGMFAAVIKMLYDIWLFNVQMLYLHFI